MSLTTAGFALLVAVDQEVPGALGAEGQQGALQQGRQQGEPQQEGPQGPVPQDRLNPKDLHHKHRQVILKHDVLKYVNGGICGFRVVPEP